jgi:hypothetical protein
MIAAMPAQTQHRAKRAPAAINTLCMIPRFRMIGLRGFVVMGPSPIGAAVPMGVTKAIVYMTEKIGIWYYLLE